jgi:DNA-binding NarL/FixJ family response regulator
VVTSADNTDRRGEGCISVLVADDHPIVRDGIRCLLDQHADIEVVGAVGDGIMAVREAERMNPKVVLMDIAMPGMSGIDATRLLAQTLPETGVLILSMHASPFILRQAVDAGARGYLCKNLNTEELAPAIRAVAEGRRYIGQGLVQALLDVQRDTGHGRHTVETLSTTERNILKLVADGLSNARVATTIGLSPRTVETYRLRMMRKLGLENLPSLVRYAIRHGIAPLD